MSSKEEASADLHGDGGLDVGRDDGPERGNGAFSTGVLGEEVEGLDGSGVADGVVVLGAEGGEVDGGGRVGEEVEIQQRVR